MKNIFQTILIFIFIITLSYQGSAQPGFLDPTFGNNGIVIEKRVGGTSGLGILPDEKSLIARSGENFTWIVLIPMGVMMQASVLMAV